MHNPCVGSFTSKYNPARKHPVTGQVQEHAGVDIGASKGSPVYAAFAGEVEVTVTKSSEGDDTRYFPYRTGNGVGIRNPDGEFQWYGHLHTVAVTKGDIVNKGHQIGTVGATGLVSGPHLHFETHFPTSTKANKYLKHFDPEALYRKYGVDPTVASKSSVSAAGTKKPTTKAPKTTTVATSTLTKLLAEVRKQATATQVNAVFVRQREYRDHTDKKIAALEKRLAAVEAQLKKQASAEQVKKLYTRQSTYQTALLKAIKELPQALSGLAKGRASARAAKTAAKD